MLDVFFASGLPSAHSGMGAWLDTPYAFFGYYNMSFSGHVGMLWTVFFFFFFFFFFAFAFATINE